MKIMVVDDSVMFRNIIQKVIQSIDSKIEISLFSNAKDASKSILLEHYDLLIVDIVMPEVDGIEFLNQLREKEINVPMVLCSATEKKDAQKVIKALENGAFSFISKPSEGSFTENKEDLREEIANILNALQIKTKKTLKREKVSINNLDIAAFKAVAIACSTGGPDVLHQVFKALEVPLSIPVFIIQHMPGGFTEALAASLSRKSVLKIVEADENTQFDRNKVYLAPGGKHMKVLQENGQVRFMTNQSAKINFVRPAADYTLPYLAEIYNAGLLTLVLTGMGRDGVDGCRVVREKNGVILHQDSKSSVVWGMPGAVEEEGLSHGEITIEDIIELLSKIGKFNRKRT